MIRQMMSLSVVLESLVAPMPYPVKGKITICLRRASDSYVLLAPGACIPCMVSTGTLISPILARVCLGLLDFYLEAPPC